MEHTAHSEVDNLPEPHAQAANKEKHVTAETPDRWLARRNLVNEYQPTEGSKHHKWRRFLSEELAQLNTLITNLTLPKEAEAIKASNESLQDKAHWVWKELDLLEQDSLLEVLGQLCDAMCQKQSAQELLLLTVSQDIATMDMSTTTPAINLQHRLMPILSGQCRNSGTLILSLSVPYALYPSSSLPSAALARYPR